MGPFLCTLALGAPKLVSSHAVGPYQSNPTQTRPKDAKTQHEMTTATHCGLGSGTLTVHKTPRLNSVKSTEFSSTSRYSFTGLHLILSPPGTLPPQPNPRRAPSIVAPLRDPVKAMLHNFTSTTQSKTDNHDHITLKCQKGCQMQALHLIISMLGAKVA